MNIITCKTCDKEMIQIRHNVFQCGECCDIYYKECGLKEHGHHVNIEVNER